MNTGFYIEIQGDYEDVDCEDCGLKFFIDPKLYEGSNRFSNDAKPIPRKCERCRKGLPPLYEY